MPISGKETVLSYFSEAFRLLHQQDATGKLVLLMEIPSTLIENQLHRGTILHSTMFENIDHRKFFAIVGINQEYVAGFFFITTCSCASVDDICVLVFLRKFRKTQSCRRRLYAEREFPSTAGKFYCLRMEELFPAEEKIVQVKVHLLDY